MTLDGVVTHLKLDGIREGAVYHPVKCEADAASGALQMLALDHDVAKVPLS